MSTRDSLPLRDQFTNAERLTRELIEHLEQGFLTRVQEVRRVARKDEDSGVTDKSVRAQCTRLFESDDFTRKLSKELHEYLENISEELQPMVFGDFEE